MREQDQRAVLLLQHIARIQDGGIVGAETGVIATGAGYCGALQARPAGLAAIPINRAPGAAAGQVGEGLQACKTQPDLRREFKTRRIPRGKQFFQVLHPPPNPPLCCCRNRW